MAFETSTFNAKSPLTVSFVAMVGGNASPETAQALTTSTSPALQAGRAGFADVLMERNDLKQEIIVEGGASARLAEIRASLGRSKEISETLGSEALGITPAQERVRDDSAKLADAVVALSEKFGAPRGSSSDTPSPQSTPAQVQQNKIVLS